ncbi:hypothetical protein [Anaeromyxobacter oryzae]|uniref:Uncharacterized protein n=1 Tax=Anaeromyxobacter oryzae TaxID=2918170 RepID=A0ABM7X3F9_9BACT|nr:hypothetical protein [Anaeromyxobacter oryzae]BDG06324.1 hypothetical protein AMOR_53200 [Anaeromyxobacter oryzae]
MNPDMYAEWLRRQGHRVVRTASSYWYDAGPRVYQAFPYHWLITPPEDELRRFLRDNGAIALRYSTTADAPEGCISYHLVCDDRGYGLDSIGKQSRQNVRLGLAKCRVERIPLERLAEEGWALERDTIGRQGREGTFDAEAWRRRYLAAADLPGFEAWGALVDGRLAASILAFTVDDCCELLSQQCLTEFVKARVNNALAFVATRSILDRPEIRSIFYTLQSLDAPASVDEFKLRMGYRPRLVRQRVVFHPWLAGAANPVTLAILHSLRQRRPSSTVLSKAEGVVRFHLQGRRPLAEQDWPECVKESQGARP